MPANLPSAGSKVGSWDPGSAGGSSKRDSVEDKLNAPNAKDGKDTMTGTNELKPFVGGSGMPKGPFGSRDRSQF